MDLENTEFIKYTLYQNDEIFFLGCVDLLHTFEYLTVIKETSILETKYILCL